MLLCHQPPSEAARKLVLRWGWNSTCYQILNNGVDRWISANGNGIVGYVRYGRWAVVAGAPVCGYDLLPQVLQEWEAAAKSMGLGVIYFGVETRLQELLKDRPGYATVSLGCQPEWTPDHFVEAMEQDRTLRAQCNRAVNKGVSVSEWPREKAENNPMLWEVLRQWLSGRGLPTLHFLVEPETLCDLRDRRIFVAERNGEAVGFVTLCPSPARSGWLTEQFVRGHKSPNGTVELMLSAAIKAIAQDGAEYVTMGIVPLSDRAELPSISSASWLRWARTWAVAHGNRFYNFRGLDTFKSKFRPESWQPVVAVVKDDRFKLKHLRAIVGAFTQQMPEVALAKGLAKAIRTEFSHLLSLLRLR